MASDDLVEAAPCPSCRSPLTVSRSDLGHLVECPGCGTQFRAREMRPETPPARSRPREDDPPPRRRPRDDDDDRDRFGEDRPRRSSGRSRFEDDDRDRDLEDDRYDDRPRSRKTPGALVAMAVMDFIYGGLLLICGVVQGVGVAFNQQLQAAGAGPMNMPREIALAFGYLGTAVLLIIAGVAALRRKGYGLSVAALVTAALMLVSGLVIGVLNIQDELQQRQQMGGPPQQGEELGVVCFVAMLSVFWLGYLVTNGILLAKSGRHFR